MYNNFVKFTLPFISLNIAFNSIISYLNDRNKDIHHDNTIHKIKLYDLEQQNKLLNNENKEIKKILFEKNLLYWWNYNIYHNKDK